MNMASWGRLEGDPGYARRNEDQQTVKPILPLDHAFGVPMNLKRSLYPNLPQDHVVGVALDLQRVFWAVLGHFVLLLPRVKP